MEDVKTEVIRKLKEYNENDIIFLKKEWQKWIDERKWNLFEKKTGVNVQTVYNILDSKKVKAVRQIKNSERYEVTLKHSKQYEISIFVVFNDPDEGDLGVVTLYKHKISI